MQAQGQRRERARQQRRTRQANNWILEERKDDKDTDADQLRGVCRTNNRLYTGKVQTRSHQQQWTFSMRRRQNRQAGIDLWGRRAKRRTLNRQRQEWRKQMRLRATDEAGKVKSDNKQKKKREFAPKENTPSPKTNLRRTRSDKDTGTKQLGGVRCMCNWLEKTCAKWSTQNIWTRARQSKKRLFIVWPQQKQNVRHESAATQEATVNRDVGWSDWTESCKTGNSCDCYNRNWFRGPLR